MNDQDDYGYDEADNSYGEPYAYLADEILSRREVKLVRVFEEREEIHTNVELRQMKHASKKVLRGRNIPFVGFTCEQCDFRAKCRFAFDPICVDGDCLMDR